MRFIKVYVSQAATSIFRNEMIFSAVPDILMQSFGKPQFLMPFNLRGSKPLVHADKDEVMEKITQQGFYLQMPKQDDGLFNSLSEIK